MFGVYCMYTVASVIYSHVLISPRVELQEELILGYVSSDGESTFERWVIVSATTVTYVPNLLHFVSWELSDLVIAMSDGIASARAGDGQ